jgi:uncharacterized tellurite resistance protein B-like protein
MTLLTAVAEATPSGGSRGVITGLFAGSLSTADRLRGHCMALLDIIRDKVGIFDSRSRLGDDHQGQALLASIMVVVAKSDGGISPEENLRMVQLLRQKFGLRPGEALQLVTRLADSFADEVEIERLIATVNQELSLADKEELMLMVVSVIAADREKDNAELKLLMTLVRDLQVPDKVMDRVYSRYFAQRQKPVQVTD